MYRILQRSKEMFFCVLFLCGCTAYASPNDTVAQDEEASGSIFSRSHAFEIHAFFEGFVGLSTISLTGYHYGGGTGLMVGPIALHGQFSVSNEFNFKKRPGMEINNYAVYAGPSICMKRVKIHVLLGAGESDYVKRGKYIENGPSNHQSELGGIGADYFQIYEKITGQTRTINGCVTGYFHGSFWAVAPSFFVSYSKEFTTISCTIGGMIGKFWLIKKRGEK